ncbi:hypothetical protein BABA_03269 [Neobacillus bataviensis LMG 21833]|uniref:t-SNARE coiled-coil homology domain-containing protein n=1 Tax=Neobacillus bataviensis LMG 21833 TaxID=1117379 RepID=K6EBN8_9BACI|nr:hypothetical protein [Neobacillus bataviensis]EKN70851.1 hypothetical protein BABA_03269 [Neobacillus bataviensis LMG 21833]
MEQTLKLILDKLDNMDQEIKRHGGLLHQLIETVAATNVKISETNQRIDGLENKVDTVIEDVKEIKNSMATKHDLEYFDQMISEHPRQIYKLKNN